MHRFCIFVKSRNGEMIFVKYELAWIVLAQKTYFQNFHSHTPKLIDLASVGPNKILTRLLRKIKISKILEEIFASISVKKN
jgi:hypothetical protein